MRTGALALALLLVGLTACHHHAAEPSDSAAVGRGVPHAATPITVTSAPPPLSGALGPRHTTEPSPAIAPGSWRPLLAPPPTPPPLTVTEVVRNTAPMPSRDLPAELRGLAGDPTSCVPPDAMATLPEHVHLSLAATVSVSGIITRAEVSGNLSPVALACVRHRLENNQFPGGVPDAPRTVSATADYDRAPRPAPTAPATAPTAAPQP